MDASMEKTVKYLAEVEEVAQDVLTNKESKLELSNAHNKYREAFRALQQADSTKTWIKCGLVYVEMNVEDCKSYLKKEIDKISEEIDCLHNKIRSDASKLRDLEHEPGIVGIGLKPISGAEARALNKAFGY